jgi:hypothetical protein
MSGTDSTVPTSPDPRIPPDPRPTPQPTPQPAPTQNPQGSTSGPRDAQGNLIPTPGTQPEPSPNPQGMMTSAPATYPPPGPVSSAPYRTPEEAAKAADSSTPKTSGDPVAVDHALSIQVNGQTWGPIACGEHNSVGVSERGSNLPTYSPVGFQSSCEACRHQFAQTLSYANQHSSV